MVARLSKILPQRLKRKDLKERDYLLLIALRYGSLTDFRHVLNSHHQIAKQTGLHQSVVTKAINRWHENGNCYRNRRLGNRSKYPLTDEQLT